jgi:hypothetical protein
MDVTTIAILLWTLSPIPLFVMWLLSFFALKRIRAENKNVVEVHEREHVALTSEFEAFRTKYSVITDQEDEVRKLTDARNSLGQAIDVLKISYATKKEVFDKLISQIAVYDDRLAFAELGIYEPHFEFQDSEPFKASIVEVRNKQKEMISKKTACFCPTDWAVEGSKSKGTAMINRQIRLTLRAFNKECEAAISNARWNNVVAMEKRILAAQKAINKENASLNLEITDAFVSLKLEELFLTHEYRERLKVEKDERAEVSRLQREETKLLAQAAKAEVEEKKYQALLDAARQEAGVDEARISELEAALKAAHDENERAKAMAEITKSGYVYVISNVGSFGEDVVKIGMTRRLDPNDRVKELGDASVPFTFDTHAMIFSEEAPALEAALHREFADRRVNISNMRKEFFRVGINDVEDAVRRLAPEVDFFKDREAQEWFETLARRKELLSSLEQKDVEFPSAL